MVKLEIFIGLIGVAVMLALFLPLTFDTDTGGGTGTGGGVGGFDNFEFARAGEFLGIDPASPKIIIEVFNDYKTKFMQFKFGEPVFQDSFSRNDSQTLGLAELGGTWVEQEPPLTNARIFNNTVDFDTVNLVSFAPAISNDFAKQTNGTIFWEFDWNFVRELLVIFFDDYNRANNNDENANSNFNYTSVSSKSSTTMIQISQSSDDAEEGCDDTCPTPQQDAMELTSGDLDLDATFWIVGLRFNNVNLAQGSTISTATVQFTAQATDTSPMPTLNIVGHDIDNAPTFTTTDGDITSRTQTTASVNWGVPDWTVGDKTSAQETPNIASIINEIVGRGGWTSGNSIVIIFERPDQGERDAESFDSSPTDAPTLNLITATGEDAWRIQDNKLDAETEESTFESYIHHNFTKQTTSSITWEFDFDFVRGGTGGGVQSFPVTQSSDDAEEEVATGDISLGSSDLEILDDGGSINQFVGVRFTDVTILQGVNVSNAFIQFTVDDTNTGLMNATIFGHDVDNSSTFTTTNSDISNRVKTTNKADWFNVPAWNTIGEAGTDQRTTDLSSIVNEILDRGSWTSGNAMTFIFNGTGEREAESFPTGEPVLVITPPSTTNGTDVNYEVFMQLGESALFFCLDCNLNFNTADDGVAVNLKWGDNNSGCTNEACIATRDNLVDTEFGTINNANSGSTHFKITADLNANTYNVLVTGVGLESGSGNVTGIPFEQNVDIDTFRFITSDQLCDVNCEIDNVEIKILENDYEMFMQIGDSASMVFPVTTLSELQQGVAVNLKYGDTSSGCINDACIATRNNGTDTEFAVIDGFTEFFIRADIDSDTYNVEVAGIGVQSGASFANNVPFENNVEVDTVRYILTRMNPDGFTIQELDNVSLSNEFSIQRAHWTSTLPPEFSTSNDIEMELYWYVDVDPAIVNGTGVCWKLGISGFNATELLPTFTTQDFKTSCHSTLSTNDEDRLITNTFDWTSSEFTLEGNDWVVIEVRRDLLDVLDDWEETANMLGVRMKWT